MDWLYKLNFKDKVRFFLIIILFLSTINVVLEIPNIFKYENITISNIINFTIMIVVGLFFKLVLDKKQDK